jgi:DNA-binding MarR family transcriptional regulator/GNAT superfamily N-acetyltransferase
MDTALVERVRSFNRTVAEGIGALDHRFLGRDRPMGEARILWEIGPAGADVRELRERLRLDSGYLSRILRSLERQRLVTVRPSPDDRRVRRARLTRTGLAERVELDRRSDATAVRVLDPLSDSQRNALVSAMQQVERLLQASMIRFAIESPTSADARWCLDQYFAELNARFDAGFDPARSISADARELAAPAGALILARFRGRPVGCGALKLHGDAPAEIKRMWIDAEMRGMGLGRRLLEELEQHARMQGVRVLRLETNRSLREAIALYRRSGYVEVDAFNDEPYADHWYQKQLLASAYTESTQGPSRTSNGNAERAEAH